MPAGFVVKKGSKIRCLVASSMPRPVSATATTTGRSGSLGSSRVATVSRPPPGMASTAEPVEAVGRLSGEHLEEPAPIGGRFDGGAQESREGCRSTGLPSLALGGHDLIGDVPEGERDDLVEGGDLDLDPPLLPGVGAELGSDDEATTDHRLLAGDGVGEESGQTALPVEGPAELVEGSTEGGLRIEADHRPVAAVAVKDPQVGEAAIAVADDGEHGASLGGHVSPGTESSGNLGRRGLALDHRHALHSTGGVPV